MFSVLRVEFASKKCTTDVLSARGNNADVLLLWKSTISKELVKVNREADFDAIVQRAGDQKHIHMHACIA